MANHILPQLSSNYTDVLSQLHDKINDIAKGLDPATTTSISPPVTVSNLVTGAISWQSSSNSWQKWTGTAWVTLSASYAINISGSAATAAKLTTARTIGGVSFDGTANITLPGVNSAGNQSTTGNAATATKLATARTLGGVSFDGTASINLPGVNTAGSQSTSGNAATATKLSTARNINGVAFDGTAAISVNTINSVMFTNAGGADPGAVFDGSASRQISWRTVGAPSFLGDAAEGTWNISISGIAATATTATTATTVTDGVYTIGDQSIAGSKNFSGRILLANGSAVTPSLTSSSSTGTGFYWVSNSINFANNGVYTGNIAAGGNLTMVGNITAYSDETLKKDWANLSDTFLQDLVNVKYGTYTRVDTGARQAGVSAQAFQKLLPEVVLADNKGLLSLSYGNAALVSAIKLAEKVLELEARISELEKQL